MGLTAYDCDGVLTAGAELKQPCVVISGRTFAEYDDTLKSAAQVCPVYIRGAGKYGDHLDAAWFKIDMIKRLGVTEMHEDHPLQAMLIKQECPNVTLVKWPRP